MEEKVLKAYTIDELSIHSTVFESGHETEMRLERERGWMIELLTNFHKLGQINQNVK